MWKQYPHKNVESAKRAFLVFNDSTSIYKALLSNANVDKMLVYCNGGILMYKLERVCGGHLVCQKLLKFNTSQAYATLYPYAKFGDDIFITFPLIDRTSSKMLSQQKLEVPSRWPFCFNWIAPNKRTIGKYYDYSSACQIWRRWLERHGCNWSNNICGNWLWRPFCFSEIANNQYQPSVCHIISVYKVW